MLDRILTWSKSVSVKITKYSDSTILIQLMSEDHRLAYQCLVPSLCCCNWLNDCNIIPTNNFPVEATITNANSVLIIKKKSLNKDHEEYNLFRVLMPLYKIRLW